MPGITCPLLLAFNNFTVCRSWPRYLNLRLGMKVILSEVIVFTFVLLMGSQDLSPSLPAVYNVEFAEWGASDFLLMRFKERLNVAPEISHL